MTDDHTKATYSLTFDDAINVWLRRFEGEYQHDIASVYGVNQGRVNDVLKGRLHPGSLAAAMLRKKS